MSYFMRVIDKEYGGEVNVYGLYHYNKDIYFYGIAVGEDSIAAFRQKDVEVIDPKFSFDVVYIGSDGNSSFMLLHWALAENNLLDDILDRDEDAINLFSKLKFIKSKI